MRQTPPQECRLQNPAPRTSLRRLRADERQQRSIDRLRSRGHAYEMRIVLDQNIVRALGHGEIGVAPFEALRSDGVRIHLADGAMTELMNQLVERRFRWKNWLVARGVLAEILDPAEPVLLGGRQGLYRAGVRGATEQVPLGAIAMAVEDSAHWWHAFMRMKELCEISKPLRIRDRVLTLSPTAARGIVETFKRDWRRDFEKERVGDELLAQVRRALPRRGDGFEQIDGVVRTIARDLDKKVRKTVGPRASVRLDAMIRVYVLLQLRSMRPFEPYNAGRHENDSFDHDLLRYLAYPAAICTMDRGVERKMRAAGCWQAPWVVHPSDLASPFGRKRICDVAWPEGRANEQS